MNARIVARTESGFTIQVEIPFRDAMLDAEAAPCRSSTSPTPSSSWPTPP
jgi:hypothetical protein